MTRQAAESKLRELRARHYKTAAGGTRIVFFVPSAKLFVAVDGIGGDRIRWSEHSSCPACK